MVVVSTNGRQDTEESIVLGMDFSSNDRYGTTKVCVCIRMHALVSKREQRVRSSPLAFLSSKVKI